MAGLRRDTGGLIPSDGSGQLSLHEAADLLGVHYMTVYRRVRDATRSQYWMLAVMVGFTSLGLWLLSASAQ